MREAAGCSLSLQSTPTQHTIGPVALSTAAPSPCSSGRSGPSCGATALDWCRFTEHHSRDVLTQRCYPMSCCWKGSSNSRSTAAVEICNIKHTQRRPPLRSVSGLCRLSGWALRLGTFLSARSRIGCVRCWRSAVGCSAVLYYYCDGRHWHHRQNWLLRLASKSESEGRFTMERARATNIIPRSVQAHHSSVHALYAPSDDPVKEGPTRSLITVSSMLHADPSISPSHTQIAISQRYYERNGENLFQFITDNYVR